MLSWKTYFLSNFLLPHWFLHTFYSILVGKDYSTATSSRVLCCRGSWCPRSGSVPAVFFCSADFHIFSWFGGWFSADFPAVLNCNNPKPVYWSLAANVLSALSKVEKRPKKPRQNRSFLTGHRPWCCLPGVWSFWAIFIVSMMEWGSYPKISQKYQDLSQSISKYLKHISNYLKLSQNISKLSQNISNCQEISQIFWSQELCQHISNYIKIHPAVGPFSSSRSPYRHFARAVEVLEDR
jgi:hypothetical protein